MEKPKIFERFFVASFIASLFFVGTMLFDTSESTNYPLSVYYLDVGQGDAELIKVGRDKEILIDGGPDSKINSSLGEVLLPFDREIEVVIISHMHADHIAGLNYLLDRRRVGKIYLFDPSYQSPDAQVLIQKIKDKNIPVEKAEQNTKFEFYGLSLKFLWPPSGSLSENPNDSSIVVDASYGTCKYLFLGDLTSRTQPDIIDSLGKIDVLKIAHHGSKDGTSDELIAKTDPEYAVIEVGKDNKFGHPSTSTIEKLRNIKTLRTDQLGTISFGCDGQKSLLLP